MHADRPGAPEEQADRVGGLDLDDGAFHRQFVVDIDPGGESGLHDFGPAVVAGVTKGGRLFFRLFVNLWQQVGVVHQRLFEHVVEASVDLFVLDGAVATAAHVEGVDGDVIAPRYDFGGQNRETGHAQRPRQFVE